MGVEPVPDQHDRRLDEVVDSVDQLDEVPLAHAAASVFAGSAGAQPVAQPVRDPGRMAISPATDRRPERRPLTVTTGVGRAGPRCVLWAADR
ncbi:hypothetical protein GCM10010339_72500 [Streptomyces alanosinicus]|uniref:Uncharacterized protein n=1 Tax=Streptomyces alanosinicus TaxID=68171 RepID=A0A918YPL2_9ACTN|nr:hypothetical protein GCM10010339_72500 [Streptomyces alanosinicus]